MQDNDFEYVGFWPRLAAYIVDQIILFVIVFIIVFIIAFSISIAYMLLGGDPENPIFDAIMNLFGAVFGWTFPAIAIILFWLHKRATPGKMIFSAQVVDEKTGKNLTVGQAIGRYFAYILSSLPLGLGFLWIAFDPRKQGWHDKLAGTVVIRPKQRGAEQVKFDA